MPVSPEVGQTLVQCGALLAVSIVIRGYCARHLPAESVPSVLSSRIQFCNRLTPTMSLIVGAMMLAGALQWLSAR
ncbi:hypothetical protein [Nocardioides sp. B-3]|uniref:hypothetical protein n=1 Tax=Nocardioides sp. B-3 TaxID=2895565 RepID=UPI00215296C7|nr:hypothetical protein [Nocardioides sp. B-3]UUZ58451.1 hypothetical protein LP418_20045 [Nocardioides sp. B-3]